MAFHTTSRLLMRLWLGCLTAALVLAVWPGSARADWLTYRGNPQRTGSVDDQPGPKAPKVTWAYKTREHFIASPVPSGNAMFIGSMAGFGTGALHCFSLDPATQQRILWSKATPYLKVPVVSAPAVAEGIMVFGDAMHQNDGGTLHALKAENGRSVWRLPLTGKLIHLESAPTIDKGRVFIGAGDAGIVCVDLKRVTVDGADQDAAAVQATIEKRWAELQAKYEEDKKKDPLALPPNEDALPKPAPKLLWQQGQNKWHVDAPMAVVADRVLVASAFIDDEKAGKRVLLCLNAADGNALWEVPLKINPWAGPTVDGNLVLVGCSSIRFDTKLIPKAQGEVVAVDLGNGQVKWRKDIPGGVLSPIAIKDGLAVFTATDGKVRACVAATGEPKWEFAAPNPFFAGPAVCAGVAYVVDIKGVLYALGLGDGKPQWTLNVAADPTVQAPGMVYGSPIVYGGAIYLATANVEGPSAGQTCAVVCVSDRPPVVAGGEGAGPGFTIDKEKRRITIPCKIAPRKLPNLQEIYPLEAVATFPAPQGQKAHETVIVFDVRPSDVHKALESFGLKPGTPGRGESPLASGPELRVSLAVPGLIPGEPHIIPMYRTMVDKRTGRTLKPLKWHFTGSALRQPDPNKDAKVYGADLTGTLITLFPVTDETVIQTNLGMAECNFLRMDINRNLLPPEGAPAQLIIEVAK